MPGVGPGEKKLGFNDAIRQALKLEAPDKRGNSIQLQPTTSGKLSIYKNNFFSITRVFYRN